MAISNVAPARVVRAPADGKYDAQPVLPLVLPPITRITKVTKPAKS